MVLPPTIHMENGAANPRNWWASAFPMGGEGWALRTRPGAGHQERKEKEGKAELIIPGVSFAQFSKGDLGSDHHLHAPLHTHRFSQATKQESGDQTAPSPLTSHPGGIRVCGCHCNTLAPSLPPGSVACDSRGHAGLSQEPGLQGQASLNLNPTSST